jgi:serine/threonine-protein kinase
VCSSDLTGFAVGSPMYMSPEQLQGVALDGRSDLYSLGVMTYLLLTGHEPFKASNMTSLALQHLQDPPPPVQKGRPDLPAEWTELVHKLLAKQPSQRHASARELLLAVERLPV